MTISSSSSLSKIKVTNQDCDLAKNQSYAELLKLSLNLSSGRTQMMTNMRRIQVYRTMLQRKPFFIHNFKTFSWKLSSCLKFQ
jgi:hypothetical protein